VSGVAVRPGTRQDQDAVAAVRVATWRSAYRGLVPDGFLDAMDPAAEGIRRRARYPEWPAEVYQYVAVSGGQVVGFVEGGRYRDPDDPTGGCGEVYALYVLPQEQGRGTGTALLELALEHLRGAGLTPVLLWVLRDNAASRRFYQRRGFTADGAGHVYQAGGVPLPEVRYRLG
jgi:GNAT superfamily N-acetyltransferase